MAPSLVSSAQPISHMLVDWAKGQPPSDEQKQQLVDWEMRYLNGAWNDFSQALDIQLPNDQENVQRLEALEARAVLLQRVVQSIEVAEDRGEFPLPGNWSDWIAMLWILWLPLAQQLDQKQKALGRPLVQGVLGGQGTGKTTLSKMLQLILSQLDHKTVPLSIDDLYLTYAQRQALLETDERLIWRGPPGTHDIDLGRETLSAMRQATSAETVSVPQFDKSLYQGQGDRSVPLVCPAPTIILLEGWFVGAAPLPADTFDQSELPDPIRTPADRQFAKDCNERLKQYLPLWNFLDALIVLCPHDYRLSVQWRQEAEQKMKASGKTGLSDEEITQFVAYFWKSLHPELFITPLTHSAKTDLVVYIGSDHAVEGLKRPAFEHAGATDCM